jgi:GNAT superfamily N-acetyltransferase
VLRHGQAPLRPDEFAPLATVGSGRVVLVARAAGVAVAVADQWQGFGVGSALARRLASEATAAGIVDAHALTAADNRAFVAG